VSTTETAFRSGFRSIATIRREWPYLVLTCAECLRAFPMNVIEGGLREILELPCPFRLTLNRCFIQQGVDLKRLGDIFHVI
jgi:hypothetical protein